MEPDTIVELRTSSSVDSFIYATSLRVKILICGIDNEPDTVNRLVIPQKYLAGILFDFIFVMSPTKIWNLLSLRFDNSWIICEGDLPHKEIPF